MVIAVPLPTRLVAGGSSISLHAYGLAIDLNPVQNPFLKRSGAQAGISPKASARFADRRNVKPGMSEPVVEVFAEHGFVVWGGEWRDPTDYQHFQVSRRFAGELARAPAAEAKRMFERHVERYRGCMRAPNATRRLCAK